MSVSALHHPNEYKETFANYRRRVKRQTQEYAELLREVRIEQQIAVSKLYNS
jgi:hypothetical protein